ncbi:MAG: HesA/MoeB/ThiF family protein [Thermodesulfobacteriota bacterium]
MSADLAARLKPHLILNAKPNQPEFYSVKEAALFELARERGLTLARIMIECLEQDLWPERFRPNRGAFSAQDQARLLKSTAAVIGAGGLGGAVCLLLARMGVGCLIVCDFDVFDESNLNRQHLAKLERLGLNKALAAVEEIGRINPAVEVRAFPVKVEEDNVREVLAPAQVVIDCLDNMPSRYLAMKAARSLNLPFIHGAVAGLEGLILTSYPEDPGLDGLYGPKPAAKDDSAESFLGVPTVTPHLIAGLQAVEAVFLLLGRPSLARRRLVHLDLSQPSLDLMTLAD